MSGTANKAVGGARGAARRVPGRRPHVLLVVPRGEAVRNFLDSDTLRCLSQRARVSLLSVVEEAALLDRYRPLLEGIHPLREYPVSPLATYLRTLTENAHDRWLWSAVAQNNWELRERRAREQGQLLQHRLLQISARMLANRAALRALTRAEQYLSWKLRRTDRFDRLLAELRPDLVFNGSHVHGLAGELPLKVAKRMGIRTAGFIFSWDNLTSRSRIFVPYDDYLVWHEPMKRQLLQIYPELRAEQVYVTGTPQFDFHFRPDLMLPREELCRRIGVDPTRPYVLYTTGIWNHFYQEHRHVELVIRLLSELGLRSKPQLVVRNYIKGTSPELQAMAGQSTPDVVFPPVLWEERWQTPRFEDLTIYSNLLRHASLGINAASTVSLELLLFDKPVINLDFDPPKTDLPWCKGYSRHIRFDHFRPVAESGAVMVARSEADMRQMLRRGLTKPEEQTDRRHELLKSMFGSMLDGRAGCRVGETLADLASSAD